MSRLAMLLGALAVAATGLAPALPARAQSDPAAQALIDKLRPSAGSTTRGLRIPGQDGSSSASTVAPAPVWQPPAAPQPTKSAPLQAMQPQRETTASGPAVSITVIFPTGSASLTPEAERALAPLGRALTAADLAPYRFRVEGHTDSVGDMAQNQTLSERRAAAVRDYLVRSFGIDASRLVPVGLGASQLLVPTPPQTAEARNRRVQIVTLGP